MSALAGAILALAVGGQAPPTFASSVDAVYVDVFVTDGGRPVTGLDVADFELRDDGVRRAVELVAVESRPLSVQLVLDVSGSLTGGKLVQLRSALRSLVRALPADDTAALLTFDDEIHVVVPRTGDRGQIEKAVERIGPGGATALHDALYTAALLGSADGRSLVVLFTDGEDNVSWLDASRVRRVVEESGVLLHAVGVVPSEDHPGTRVGDRDGPLRPDGSPAAAPEPEHVRVLRGMAEVTGGRFWRASSAERLTEAFSELLQAMKARYVLRFEPRQPGRGGRHELEVKLARRKGRVHCRRAYFTPAAPEPAGGSKRRLRP